VDAQAAARAADRATIALHGPARAVTNFELDCYGPEACQRSGDDLKAYLLALRPPPRAGDPGRAAAAAPSSAAARRCGRCAACRQPWRRGAHGHRLHCTGTPAGGAGDAAAAGPRGRPACARAAAEPETLAPAGSPEQGAGAAAAAAAAPAAATAPAAGVAAPQRPAAAAGAAGGAAAARRAARRAASAVGELAVANQRAYARQETQRRMDAALVRGAPPAPTPCPRPLPCLMRRAGAGGAWSPAEGRAEIARGLERPWHVGVSAGGARAHTRARCGPSWRLGSHLCCSGWLHSSSSSGHGCRSEWPGCPAMPRRPCRPRLGSHAGRAGGPVCGMLRRGGLLALARCIQRGAVHTARPL